MAFPQARCVEACVALTGKLKAPADNTDWTTMIAVADGAAGNAAGHYITARLPDVASIRRARTLLAFIRAQDEVLATTPHPFVVGDVKTAGGSDYAMLLDARAVAVHWAEARRQCSRHQRLCSKEVMAHIVAALGCSRAAGPWPYDETLAPAALGAGVVNGLEMALVGAIAQHSTTAKLPGPAAACLRYSATALLATLASAVLTPAGNAVAAWATAEAKRNRTDAAVAYLDPRPPGRSIPATFAQLVLETHQSHLTEAGKKRLALAVALNGYMRTSAPAAEVTDAETAAPEASLRAVVIEPAIAQLRQNGIQNKIDSLAPFADTIALHRK